MSFDNFHLKRISEEKDSDTGYFEGFSWALPSCFAEAIDKCAFQTGDVIYENRESYSTHKWDGKMIQVQYPDRTLGVSLNEQPSREVFRNNWYSEAHVVIYENCDGKITPISERIRTTQGGIYTALWKNDLTWITDQQKTPEIPEELSASKRILPDSLLSEGRGSKAFVMSADLASPVSRQKIKLIRHALREHLADIGIYNDSPDLNDNSTDKTKPTSCIVIFWVSSIRSRELINTLKDILYKPNPEAKADRFSLKAHGIIYKRISDKTWQTHIQEKETAPKERAPIAVEPSLRVHARIRVTYTDQKGNESSRTLEVTHLILGARNKIKAICLERHATRTFYVDRISMAFDPETGEIIDDLEAFLRNNHMPTEANASRHS